MGARLSVALLFLVAAACGAPDVNEAGIPLALALEPPGDCCPDFESGWTRWSAEGLPASHEHLQR